MIAGLKRPTGQLRWLVGHGKSQLQQEFVAGPVQAVQNYLARPDIDLIVAQVELSWENVPVHAAGTSEEMDSVPDVPGRNQAADHVAQGEERRQDHADG